MKAAAVQPAAPAISVADEQAIQGTWEVVSSTFKLIQLLNEKESILPEQALKTARVVITPDALTILGEHVEIQSYRYQLNPEASPRMIDLESRSQYWGIYRLEGNLLKICADNHYGQRPSQFFADFGSDKELLVLRRIGDAVAPEDAKTIQGKWQVESLSTPSGAPAGSNRSVYLAATTGTWFTPGHQTTITANQITITVPPGMGGGGKLETVWYTLDPSSRPKRCAFGSLGSDYFSGIYELTNDRLTICLGLPDVHGRSNPPSKLVAEAETVLVVLKRVDVETSTPDKSEADPIEALEKAYNIAAAQCRAGVIAECDRCPAMDALLEAKIAAAKTKTERIALLQKLLENRQEYERAMKVRYESGRGIASEAELDASQGRALEAESRLEKEKVTSVQPPPKAKPPVVSPAAELKGKTNELAEKLSVDFWR